MAVGSVRLTHCTVASPSQKKSQRPNLLLRPPSLFSFPSRFPSPSSLSARLRRAVRGGSGGTARRTGGRVLLSGRGARGRLFAHAIGFSEDLVARGGPRVAGGEETRPICSANEVKLIGRVDRAVPYLILRLWSKQ
ncbi:hypothetical protein EJB05_21616, partial [Eragrostis curvula]